MNDRDATSGPILGVGSLLNRSSLRGKDLRLDGVTADAVSGVRRRMAVLRVLDELDPELPADLPEDLANQAMWTE